MKRLLVLCNGAGEDAIAAKILARLPEEMQSSVVCCPLVGEGKALASRYELCGPRVLPPSEGLFRESALLAARDLWHGVLAGHLGQLKFLRRCRQEVDLTVAVGDLFPVLWGGLAGHRKLLFVGTAKSVYHHPYSAPERWLLRRFATRSLVRDAATASRLQEQEVNAQWVGNAMMDEVQPTGKDLPGIGTGPLVTLFPGSRAQASEVLPFQLDAISSLSERLGGSLQAAVAAAPGTDPSVLAESCEGWELQPSDGGDGLLSTLVRGEQRVSILVGRLGDLLAHSALVLGQAGTANEQAAGAGVPVVAYDTRAGQSLRWYRKRQKGLLGDAVAVVAPTLEAVVEEAFRLLSDPHEHQRRAEIGRERMGPAGGTQKMAAEIVALWNP